MAWYVFNFLYSSFFASSSLPFVSISSTVVTPLSLNLSNITLNTFTVVSTSSNALCATSTFIPNSSAILPSLYFFIFGNTSFASVRVSRTV